MLTGVRESSLAKASGAREKQKSWDHPPPPDNCLFKLITKCLVLVKFYQMGTTFDVNLNQIVEKSEHLLYLEDFFSCESLIACLLLWGLRKFEERCNLMRFGLPQLWSTF